MVDPSEHLVLNLKDEAVQNRTRTIELEPNVNGVIELTLLPVRGSIWANDRYHVAGRARSWFFTEDGSLGVYPLLFFESTYGLLVGAQVEIRPARGHKVELFGGVGFDSRHRVSLEYHASRYLDDRLDLAVGMEVDRKPKSRFYGIGNADEIDTPPVPIDPFMEELATKSYFDDRLARVGVMVSVEVAPSSFVDVGGAVSDRERSDSPKEPSIEMVFEPSSLIAFDDYQSGYAELQLRYDSRRPGSDWQPRHVLSAGSLASGYIGRTTLDPGDGFWRGGIDLQQYIPLGVGPRVLSLRFEGEAVSAEPDEVPFTELASLGGRQWLRGYANDRFRDQVSAVAVAEYQWDLASWLYASVFVDVGRVYSGLDDLTLSGLRCGFGVSLEAHTPSILLGRISIASSIDGGAYVNLYLDPVSEIEPRVRRR